MVNLRMWWLPTLLALVLGCDAGEKPRSTRDSAQTQPQRDARVASLEAELARARFELASSDFDRLDSDISMAVTAVADATTDAQRATASKYLKSLQRRQYEIKQRMAALRNELERFERMNIMPLRRECIENPLATTCA